MTDHNDASEPSSPRRSRLDDELRDILIKADQPTSLADHVRRKTQMPRARQRPTPVEPILASVRHLSGGALLIASLVVAFVASWTRDTSALLATLLAIMSVALLASIFVGQHRGPGQSDVKQWRGRDLDLGSPPPAWVGSLRDRFKGPPKR